MSKKYPNANIRLEDSTGKILNENVFIEAFKLEKALKGMGYDVKVKYLDDFGKDIFEIYFNNPSDADDSIFDDAKKLGYDNVRVFANPQESVNEGDTYEKMAAKGKKAGNLKQGTVRKRLGIPKDKKIPLSLINKELARLKKMDKDPNKKGAQLGDKNQKYYKALQLAKTLKTTTNVNENIDPKAQAKHKGTSSPFGSAYSLVKELAEEVMKQKGYSKYLKSKDNPKGETDGLTPDVLNKILMNIAKDIKETKQLEEGASTEEKRIAMSAVKKIAKYRGVSEDEARNDLIRAAEELGSPPQIHSAKELGSLKEAVKQIFETIQLGKQLDEKKSKLCKRGRDYIAARKRAGEKSSAYLSGRAVKVCKGQIKGAGGKKRKDYKGKR